ncbi:MAG: CG0192-related protein [Angustibacter sp.]
MAVHHPATIVPGKLELLQAWVPQQQWAQSADTSTLARLGSYRFDDPDGEVGMETHLLGTADGQVLQVPLTYRGAPLAGADEALVTTMTHSTLGLRWVYDGLRDPVYLTALRTTILTGGREADLFAATDAGLVLEPSTTHVRGSGSSATGAADDGVLTFHHVPGPVRAGLTLTGTWPGQEAPALLASID